MTLNRVTIIGHIGQNPELRYLPTITMREAAMRLHEDNGVLYEKEGPVMWHREGCGFRRDLPEGVAPPMWHTLDRPMETPPDEIPDCPNINWRAIVGECDDCHGENCNAANPLVGGGAELRGESLFPAAPFE